MTDDKRLEEKLEAFSARAKRVAPACDNEEQTKISLINPYLEFLGYDVRDPAVCRLEFVADIGKAGEKVDYAIMRDGQPSILIEAKAASVDLSNDTVPSQLQRYFMAVNADFAAFTNGVIWQWYRASSRDARLEGTPFLIHDVRSPSRRELHWLLSVSGPEFDRDKARAQAEGAGMVSAILSWIEEMRHQPSDDLLRVIIRSRGLGMASASRMERTRRTFVEAFQTYLNREADRLIDAAREQRQEEARPQGETSSPTHQESDAVRTIDLGDGKPPLTSRAFARAWRVRGGAWRRAPSGRTLMIAVIRYLASLDVRGRQRYYAEAIDSSEAPLFPPEKEGQRGWRRVESDIDRWVYVHMSNQNQERFLSEACAAVQPRDGGTIRLGDDIEVLLVL